MSTFCLIPLFGTQITTYAHAQITYFTGVMSATHMEGTMDELKQRGMCGLPSRHAQLVAKAQHLLCTPPSTQVCHAFCCGISRH
jgi:hypothetical protein